MDIKRIFLIVLDSVGIGALPDANLYGDEGSNTLRALWESGGLYIPEMTQLGLYNIDGMDYAQAVRHPTGCFARLSEFSKGKLFEAFASNKRTVSSRNTYKLHLKPG